MSTTAATVFAGPAGTIPVVNSNGQIYEEVQVAAAGQTAFVLTAFQYTPNTRSIFVFKNGLRLRRAVDFTETNNTTITLAVAATLNDVLTFQAFAVSQTLAPLQNNGVIPAGTANQVLAKKSGSDYDLQWLALSSIATLLDQPVSNVASAPTVDVTGLASTTRNILITGTTQIDGWAITAGQVFLVKFQSSLQLSNNVNQVTPTGAAIKVGPNDSCFVRATANNVVEILSFVKSTAVIPPQYNDHRLSLVSGSPVADSAAASTLYLTAYKGNNISLFNGTAWVVRQFTEINIALAGLTVGRPYDVFCYDNAGTPTLEILAWASAAARVSNLIRQDGVYVKGTDVTRKYIGTFYATSATQTVDSSRQRHIWNMYNRVRRDMQVTDAAVSWNYTTAAWRQANANALNQLEITVGVSEDTYAAELKVRTTNSAAGSSFQIGIGENTLAGPTGTTGIVTSTAANYNLHATASLRNKPALGFTYLAWLETSDAIGVYTWYGSGFSQLTAQWMC